MASYFIKHLNERILPPAINYQFGFSSMKENRGLAFVMQNQGMKITELILDKIAYGWSPEEVQFQHPHLNLGQIYSALAYYPDHQEELGEIIQRQLEHVDHKKKKAQPTPLFTTIACLNSTSLPKIIFVCKY